MVVKNPDKIIKNFLNEIKSNDLISKDIRAEYFNDPFEHVRIFNIFKPDIYNEMCIIAEKLCNTVQSDKYKTADGFKKYAKIYGVKAKDAKGNGYEFFSSKSWIDFISNIFDLKLERFVSSALHFHEGSMETPSTLGWAHTDMNVCSFREELAKENSLNGLQYSDDIYTFSTMDYDPKMVNKMNRSAAYLYYLNNKEDLTPEDGGGTFVYGDRSTDNPIKVIPPTNNTLFLFKMTPSSFHGAQPAKFHRYVNVGWVHSEPAEFLHRNLALAKECVENNITFFEEWDDNNPWNIEKSPYYNKFFTQPLKYLFD